MFSIWRSLLWFAIGVAWICAAFAIVYAKMHDDKFTDEEIRELWQEHFPKRHADAKSRLLCESVRLIIEQRAADYAEGADDIDDAVRHELSALGIPREEFYEIEKEAKDE